ncbi:MAG: HNH endonuclease [Candidatus Dormibacteraceae bacterium]
MEKATGLPFHPRDPRYPVWRNYGRVFQAALLAARVGDQIIATELAQALAHGNQGFQTADDYLIFLIPRFSMPSPARDDYDSSGPRVFPFCCVIRYLLAQDTPDASIGLDEIFAKIVSNGCVGNEPLEFYQTLPTTAYSPQRDEDRQVRELTIFISQFSALKWDNASRRLYLDIAAGSSTLREQLLAVATPMMDAPSVDRTQELQRLGSTSGVSLPELVLEERASPDDEAFTEGRRVRVYHLRIERSRKLRALFFGYVATPYRCDMCRLVPANRYPWTTNILELHHLLPLSSPLRVGESGTHLEDLVCLCPSCHRATHAYYLQWLKNKDRDDFRAREEAKEVYDEAKAQLAA